MANNEQPRTPVNITLELVQVKDLKYAMATINHGENKQETSAKGKNKDTGSYKDSDPQFTMMVNEDGTILHINRPAPEKYIGTKIYDYLDAVEHTKIKQSIIDVFKTELKNGSVTSAGRKKPKISSEQDPASIIEHSVLLSPDITEENLFTGNGLSAKSEFLQSKRLEALGKYSSEIIHDFNNILTVMLGYAQMLSHDFNDESTMEGHAISMILKGAERSANITKQILLYARGSSFSPESFSFSETVPETFKEYENIYEERIDVTFDFDEKADVIDADKTKMHQIFMNLIINAKEAMPFGGRIHVKTELVTIAKEDIPSTSLMNPGKHVKIIFADTGTGIPERIQHQVFEPFFSTKTEGKGTGLGLATVGENVREHCGGIELESEVGKGTAFIIHLPVEQEKGAVILDESSSE